MYVELWARKLLKFWGSNPCSGIYYVSFGKISLGRPLRHIGNKLSIQSGSALNLTREVVGYADLVVTIPI